MNFLQKLKDFSASPTHIRTAGILIALIILAAIPLTVIISQKQQEIRQRASTSGICSVIDQLPTCTDLQSSCLSKDIKCKIGQTIYICQEQP